MACKNVCQVCDKLRYTDGVSFTGGNLVYNLRAGNYGNGCKYCIVFAQTAPEGTTVNAPVYLTIGTGTELYPLVDRNGVQVTARDICTRRRYATRVVTNATSGNFRLLCQLTASANALASINGTAPTPAPAPTA